ncbi:MarR family transcriptional regulator [Microbacteriaceae bacterium VKM Ac-2855]|nr:MarR family transcriptional regulator [Microbacteriaceae bacterium VKM Ac-2855]
MADQRPIGYWLKLVDRLIDERFAETLDEHGVTRRQWQLLNVLSRGPGTTEQLDAAVAPFLQDDDGESAAEHLTELVESGWITAGDAGFAITERGTLAFTRLAEVVAANRTAATQGLTQEQYDETLRVLEVLARNLGWQG